MLSHTNVARDEIARRLAQTPEGAQLLSYPHYIGTIHGFVNQFFALSMLRTLEQKVEVIDDAVFADKARARLQLDQFRKLRFFLDKQNNGDDILTTLFYRTAELSLKIDKGTLPGAHTQSYQSLVSLKGQLSHLGIFRHRDMFAYADLALKTCPHLVEVVHRRFPMVFIDEMQDTSWDQESFLNRIFDGKSVMQRFGDVDQKILQDEENADLLTFPRHGHGSISTSKRFGDAIGKRSIWHTRDQYGRVATVASIRWLDQALLRGQGVGVERLNGSRSVTSASNARCGNSLSTRTRYA